MDPLIGKTLGQYQIISEIGRGGMATVYRGMQTSLGRPVAIKVLLSELSHDPDFRQRFQREAYAVAQLAHPNILPVYDFGQDPATGAVYFVTQYVDGGTLAARMGRPMPPEEASRIAAQIARALDCAHSRGIIHRDIKPSNVLMTREGHPLLTDFGIAKIMAETRLTRTGTSMGTPAYMSPEQAQGKPVDHRADLYALGIMFYEMLAGSLPFEADTPLSLLHLHVTKEPPPLRERAPEVSRSLERIVMRALAKDPDDRFATAGELAEALEAEFTRKRRPSGPGPRGLTSILRREKRTPTPTPAQPPAPGAVTAVEEAPPITPPPSVDLRPRPRSRLARTMVKLQVGQRAKGLGRWLLRAALGVLGILLIVAIALLIGAAFLLGSIAEQTLASQRWVLDNIEPGASETVACTDIQKSTSQTLQPYFLEALTDVTATCLPPDLVELSGNWRGTPVSLRGRVFALNHVPAVRLERLNNISLYIVGGIISDGVNRGIAKAWTQAPVRLGEFSVTGSGIEIKYEANP
jgi:serine/threonine-protein kinase